MANISTVGSIKSFMLKNCLRKTVAYKDKTVCRENLPYPIVYYPGHYGTFFGFKKDNSSPITLCSCSKLAMMNYLQIRFIELQRDRDLYGLREDFSLKNPILGGMHFPQQLIQNSLSKDIPQDENIFKFVVFKNKLCHECNLATPHYNFCVSMYGSAFKQNYGWYINKQSFEWGIAPISNIILQSICPDEIKKIIKHDPKQITTLRENLGRKINKDCPYLYQAINLNGPIGKKVRSHYCRSCAIQKVCKENEHLEKILKEQNTTLIHAIENEVRLKFKHKKIGEAWTSETILFYLLEKLFPQYHVHYHYHCVALERLELDIYIEEMKLGIEYQGAQHFFPVDHWGGRAGLQALKKRDKKKKRLCEKAGIKIIYFNYNEGLSEEIVRERINKVLE